MHPPVAGGFSSKAFFWRGFGCQISAKIRGWPCLPCFEQRSQVRNERTDGGLLLSGGWAQKNVNFNRNSDDTPEGLSQLVSVDPNSSMGSKSGTEFYHKCCCVLRHISTIECKKVV